MRGGGSRGVGPRPALYTTTGFFILLADARNLAASPFHLNPSRYNATVFTSSTVPELPREAQEELRRLLSPIADYILAAYEKWGKPILVVSFGSSPQVKTLEKTKRETCGGEHS